MRKHPASSNREMQAVRDMGRVTANIPQMATRSATGKQLAHRGRRRDLTEILGGSSANE